jgi:hypothetical protein
MVTFKKPGIPITLMGTTGQYLIIKPEKSKSVKKNLSKMKKFP